MYNTSSIQYFNMHLNTQFNLSSNLVPLQVFIAVVVIICTGVVFNKRCEWKINVTLMEIVVKQSKE